MTGKEKLLLVFGVAIAAGAGYAFAPKKNTVIHDGVVYEEAELIPVHTPHGGGQWNISGGERIVIQHNVTELTDAEVALIKSSQGYTHAAKKGFRSMALLLKNGDKVIWWNPIPEQGRNNLLDAEAFLDVAEVKEIR